MGKNKEMSIFKQMKQGLKEVGQTIAPPDDLVILDRCVKHQVTNYDGWIASFDAAGSPPTQETAGQIETDQINERCAAYMAEAQAELKRGPKGGGDEMVEREGALRRSLDARRGQLFAKFSGEVAGLQGAAARILSLCVSTLAATEASLTARLPLSAVYLDLEFDRVRAELADHVAQGFPGGAAKLDAYDDGLPDGVPSYDQFKASVDAAEARVVAANEGARVLKMAALKEGIAAQMAYNTKMAMKRVMLATKAEIGGADLSFMSADALTGFRAELEALADEAVAAWAPFPDEAELAYDNDDDDDAPAAEGGAAEEPAAE